MASVSAGPLEHPGLSAWDELSAAFGRLDRALARAVAARRGEGPDHAAGHAFRGLVVSDDDVARVVVRPPGTGPLDGTPGDDASFGEGAIGPRFGWLARSFGLSAFDLGVVLLALGPHIDLKYERIYAYLHDDVTRKRPSVGLALELLCRGPAERLARRGRFAAGAPLVRHGIVRLGTEPHQPDAPLPARVVTLAPQVVNVLVGQHGMDERLEPFCHLFPPGALPADDDPLVGGDVWPGLASLVRRAVAEEFPVRLHLHGPMGSECRAMAELMACAAGAPLLSVELNRLPVALDEAEAILRLATRDATLHGAFLALHDLDALSDDPARASVLGVMAELLSWGTGVVLLTGTRPWTPASGPPAGLVGVSLGIPDPARRRACWLHSLQGEGIAIAPDDLETLAGRFRLSPGQIAAAAAAAKTCAAIRAWGADDDAPTLDDLFAAARARSGIELSKLARKVEPSGDWDDLVLPDDSLAQLRELCARASRRDRVLDGWGFGRTLKRGTGTSALFAGPPGTGKTMAAGVIAAVLGLDLYAIDLAGVVSKYIGETEKNLDRIFHAAVDSNAVLLFDEADALFGKRSEVRDAHDRYANIEISYLLQKIEQYEGVALLATNLRQNLDEAFTRRLAFTVSFPAPDETHRRRIWRKVWPAEVPLAADVDFDLLARRFRFSGGQIKNVALAAAFLADEEGSEVGMDHLLHATRREFQKMGKTLSDRELYDSPVLAMEAVSS